MKKVVPLEGFGGGGTPLNFKIAAYATEEELLAAQPKENTIGVITDTPITGYKFSATEPEDMVEGEVWICVGTESNVAFDIVDGAKIYPLFVKQYISDAWVDKTAMSYQNEEWVDWFMYLYNAGNECTDITGGFYYEARILQSNQVSSGSATLTKNQSSMTLTHTSTSGSIGSAICAATKKIDLTDVKNIVMNYSDVSAYKASLCVWSSIGTYTIDNVIGRADILTAQGTISEGEISLDTSSLSGEHVVGLYISASYSITATITINNIYCEK